MQAYETYSGEILLVYHPYPTQPLSETIAVALEAAGQQGKFWEMHDLLIDDDPGDIAVMIYSASISGNDVDSFTADSLEVAAEQAGLDMDAFRIALNDTALLEKVRVERQEAITDGVQSAAVFINGEEYREGHSTLDAFFEVLDAELERLETDAAD